jgi:hypothetical protein
MHPHPNLLQEQLDAGQKVAQIHVSDRMVGFFAKGENYVRYGFHGSYLDERRRLEAGGWTVWTLR